MAVSLLETYNQLKQYIDENLTKAKDQLKDLFVEYKTKEVGNHLDDILHIREVYIGSYDTAPTTRYDGSAIQAGDFYFDENQKTYRTWDGTTWITQYGGLYADANKGIAYIYTKSNENETIKIPEGTNGYSVNNYTLENGAELVIPDGSVYKIL